jgi:predicted RNA-binding protein with RPS1 domain
LLRSRTLLVTVAVLDIDPAGTIRLSIKTFAFVEMVE